ncbi:MAG: RDD family protein [Steroidobacteraceae bacterium]
MIWYVRRSEREIGPLGDDALRALVGTGQITPDTQLWREGLSGWTSASVLPGILGPRGAASPATDSQPPVALASEPPRAAVGSPAIGATIFELATPWRRYWARSLDIAACSFLAALLISAIRPSLPAQVSAQAGWRWMFLLLLLPAALMMDTLVYWALGNTPGKALAGVKVLKEGGRRPLRAAAYLGRNFGLYVFGLGFGLPLISLFPLIYNYWRAAAAKPSMWDRLSGSRAYALSGAELRTWVTAGVYALGLTALVALGLHGQHIRSRYTAARAPVSNLQQVLAQAARRVNASSPRMIDEVTRLDGAHLGPGPDFTYDYTITNMRTSLLSPMTLATLRWRLSAHVQQAICAGSALKPMLRDGTIVRIRYSDRDGREIALVSVSSADCAG